MKERMPAGISRKAAPGAKMNARIASPQGMAPRKMSGMIIVRPSMIYLRESVVSTSRVRAVSDCWYCRIRCW